MTISPVAYCILSCPLVPSASLPSMRGHTHSPLLPPLRPPRSSVLGSSRVPPMLQSKRFFVPVRGTTFPAAPKDNNPVSAASRSPPSSQRGHTLEEFGWRSLRRSAAPPSSTSSSRRPALDSVGSGRVLLPPPSSLSSLSAPGFVSRLLAGSRPSRERHKDTHQRRNVPGCPPQLSSPLFPSSPVSPLSCLSSLLLLVFGVLPRVESCPSYASNQTIFCSYS